MSFYAIQSVASYSNPQIVHSVHTTLAGAVAAAQAQAQQSADAANADYAAAQQSTRFAVEREQDAAMLDAHILATFRVADECFNVTADIAAYLSGMLRTD